jgi:hypothetical protein
VQGERQAAAQQSPQGRQAEQGKQQRGNNGQAWGSGIPPMAARPGPAGTAGVQRRPPAGAPLHL